MVGLGHVDWPYQKSVRGMGRGAFQIGACTAAPPGITRPEARRAQARARNFIDRAVNVLDLSAVPRALRPDVGVETVMHIKEIIDRVPLPPIESVPQPREVAELRAGLDAGERVVVEGAFFLESEVEKAGFEAGHAH